MVTLPAAATIDQALSGQFGPVAITYRFEWRTSANIFIADITTAFAETDGCTIHVDNDQPVSGTADFHIIAKNLPIGFNVSSVSGKAVAVFADVHTPATVFSQQMGLYFIDYPTVNQFPLGWQEWTATASDMTIVLANHTTPITYGLSAGVNYLTTVQSICTSFGLSVGSWTNAAVLPGAVQWAPGTSYLTIVNDILYGLNYYPIYADNTGVLQTRVRVDPSTETAAVTYSSVAEPRMLVAPTQLLISISQWHNYVTVAIDDPARTVYAAIYTNADPSSPLSTVASGKTDVMQLSGSGTPSTKCLLDGPTANAIAIFELQEEATRAVQRTIHTAPDPRRTNREWYRLYADSYEIGTLWRCAKWDLPCVPGGDMQHTLGSAAPVSISLGPPALTAVVQRLGTHSQGSSTVLGGGMVFTIPVTTASGNGIVIAVLADTAPSGWSCADTQGNTYTLLADTRTIPFGTTAPAPVAGAGQFYVGVFQSITSHALVAGTDSITVSIGSGGYFVAGSAWEIAYLIGGLDAAAGSASATDGTGADTLITPYTSGTGVTASSTDLVVGVLGVIWNPAYFSAVPPPAGSWTPAAGQGWLAASETIVPINPINGLYPTLIVELALTIGTGSFTIGGTLSPAVAGWGALVVPIAGSHL